MFTPEEIIKWLLAVVGLVIGGVLTTYARDLSTQFKELQKALQANTNAVADLNKQVSQLDAENRTLRTAHDALTTWLIAKKILPTPPPPSPLTAR